AYFRVLRRSRVLGTFAPHVVAVAPYRVAQTLFRGGCYLRGSPLSYACRPPPFGPPCEEAAAWRRCWSPTGARSPCACCAPAASSAWSRWRSTPTPTATPSTSRWPTRPGTSARRPRPRATSTSTPWSTRPAGPRPGPRAAFAVELPAEAWRTGEATPATSYLNVAAVVDAARRAKADAVPPGYGFL